MRERDVQSTKIPQIKAALWEQAFFGGTQVRCPLGQVVAIRKRNGQLQAMIRGWGRWCTVGSVSIDRMFVRCPLSSGPILSESAPLFTHQDRMKSTWLE